MAEPYVFRGNSYRDHAALKHWIMRARKEQALEPELAIVDPHHHLWDDGRDRRSGAGISGHDADSQPRRGVPWRGALCQSAEGRVRRLADGDPRVGGVPERGGEARRTGHADLGFDLHLLDEPPSSEVLAATWKPYIEACIEAFGADRCMFESNFPVDKQSCDYTACWNAFKRLSAGASAVEKTALFSGTAARVYKVEM